MKAEIKTGDVLTVLPTLPDESADLVFADPPFNVGKRYGTGSQTDKRTDYVEWCEAWIAECFRLLKPTGSIYLMTITRHLETLFPLMARHGVFINQIVWRRTSGACGKRQFWNIYQPILLYGKTKDFKFHTYAQRRDVAKMNLRWGQYSTQPQGQMLDCWDDIPFVFAGGVAHKEAILKPGTNSKAHPCQMPVALAARAIQFSTDEGDTVLDPFTGSGAVAVAAQRLNRNFVGVEINPEYAAMSQQRISNDAPLFNEGMTA